MNPINQNAPVEHRAQRPFLRGRELLNEMRNEQKLTSRIGHFVKGSFLVVMGSIPFGISRLSQYIKNKRIKEITHEPEGAHHKVRVVVLGLEGKFTTSLHKAVQEQHPDWTVELRTTILRTVPKDLGNPDILIVGAQRAGGRLVVRTPVQTDYGALMAAAGDVGKTFLVAEASEDEWVNLDQQLFDSKMEAIISQTGATKDGKFQVKDFSDKDHLWSYHPSASKLTDQQNAMLEQTIASLNQPQ